MDDQVTKTMGSKELVSIETSISAPLKPNKLMVKLKISKHSFKSTYGASNQHVCPICSKGFTSGKALGGHIRIHMIKGSKNGSRPRKISKHLPKSNAKSKKKNSSMASFDDQNQENNEKVSCCLCNKDFKSMKSLFGHMRNHPERNWRGIRPPPLDKNSCCSSVSENDEAFPAHEVVDQIKGSSSVSDLVKSLPNSWSNTCKRFDKSSSSSDHDRDDEDDEIPEAAYCLMQLSRGHPFDLNHWKPKTKNPSSDKASELKGKAKVKTESEFLTKELNEEARITKSNRFWGQFKKIPLKPNEEKLNPYRGQRHDFYPKNPTYEAADNGSQVCSPKVQLEFDLNELPYVEGLDGDDQA